VSRRFRRLGNGLGNSFQEGKNTSGRVFHVRRGIDWKKDAEAGSGGDCAWSISAISKVAVALIPPGGSSKDSRLPGVATFRAKCWLRMAFPGRMPWAVEWLRRWRVRKRGAAAGSKTRLFIIVSRGA